jgi:hypothetical protein
MKLIRRLHFPVLLSGLWLTAVGSYVHDYYRDRLIGGSSGFGLILAIAAAAIVPCIVFFVLASRDARRAAGSSLTT